MTTTLTERRKADRAAMAGQVAELARQHGLTAIVTGEQHGSRETSVSLEAPHGLRLTVRFRGRSPQTMPDTYVLSWYTAVDQHDGWQLNPYRFGDVNPYHGCKATDVVHGFESLCRLLDRRFTAIALGWAFIAAPGTSPEEQS
jgi:hypothetical protein